MTDHETAVRTEREGFTATCSCGWLRWAATRKQALNHAHNHTKER